MNGLEQVQGKRREILEIAERYGASNLRIFGSVARGDADDESDIDLVVDLEPGRTLFDRGGMQMDLEAAMGRPVDVVTEKGLRSRLRSTVFAEAMAL